MLLCGTRSEQSTRNGLYRIPRSRMRIRKLAQHPGAHSLLRNKVRVTETRMRICMGDSYD